MNTNVNLILQKKTWKILKEAAIGFIIHSFLYQHYLDQHYLDQGLNHCYSLSYLSQSPATDTSR